MSANSMLRVQDNRSGAEGQLPTRRPSVEARPKDHLCEAPALTLALHLQSGACWYD